jgi:hypothetical protein
MRNSRQGRVVPVKSQGKAIPQMDCAANKKCCVAINANRQSKGGFQLLETS